jgi:hypothetical protein
MVEFSICMRVQWLEFEFEVNRRKKYKIIERERVQRMAMSIIFKIKKTVFKTVVSIQWFVLLIRRNNQRYKWTI